MNERSPAGERFVYNCRVREDERKEKSRFWVMIFFSSSFFLPVFLLHRFRAIHKYTQSEHGSNKFLIAPLSWQRVVCSAAEGLGEKPGEAAENSYLPFITGGGGGQRKSEEMKRQECVFFLSAPLSKERGELSFRTAGLWNLDWRLQPRSRDRISGIAWTHYTWRCRRLQLEVCLSFPELD